MFELRETTPIACFFFSFLNKVQAVFTSSDISDWMPHPRRKLKFVFEVENSCAYRVAD